MAAEGFRVRYNLAGSLGAEMFAAPPSAGWGARLTYTDASIHKLTGDGNTGPAVSIPGGQVPLAAPAPAAFYPSYGPSPAQVTGTGSLRQWNLLFGYITEAEFSGGRLAWGVNLPYVRRQQAYQVRAATPTLNWPAAAPAGLRGPATARFDAQYQAALTALGNTEGGEMDSLGDIELSAGWLRGDERMQLAAGVALALPTGNYDPGRGVDTSYGDFYTLRPSVQAAWQFADHYVAGLRMVLGLNTRNRQNDLRSGHWAGLEGAVGRRFGPVSAGVQVLHLQQIQDDRNNPFGASRYRSTQAGVFLTVPVPVLNASLSLQYMASVNSRNAQHGRFAQLRLARAF